MPTIAIIGGGTGGNLLAARLLERAPGGQRLNVMLVEARGRAGPHLRGILRQAERAAPGGFLTRLRGEALSLADRGDGRVRIGLRSGRVLDVDRAVVIVGSVAAAPLVETGQSRPPGVHELPSEGTAEALAEPVEHVADSLVADLGSDRESVA